VSNAVKNILPIAVSADTQESVIALNLILMNESRAVMSDEIPIDELIDRFVRYESNIAALKLRDPIAAKTDWETSATSGLVVDQRSLKITGPQTAQLRVSYGASVMSSIQLVIGLIALYALSQQDLKKLSENVETLLMFLGPGLLFTVLGAYSFYGTNIPQRFDRQLGVYWRGFGKPQLVTGSSSSDELVWLREVYAVQLIYYKIFYRKKYYYGAQVHLVLNDTSRCLVINGRDIEQIRVDAGRLSQLLNVRLWSP